MLATTPLHTNHLQLGAKMVDFHHWDLPLHYGSQIEEHHAVRQAAGAFDVSHMTILDVLGVGGRQFLRQLLTNDIDAITHNGQALYSCMCNEQGGVLDDVIVYQRAADSYRVVLNSATRERDLDWIRRHSQGLALGLQERKDLAMIAVQGPEAIAKTMSIISAAAADSVSTLRPFEFVENGDYFFAYTGYTGEQGLEVILPANLAAQFWEALMAIGVKPCGLAARDTLRLEAGLMLYGQDMDETITPLEAGLGWTIKWEPRDRDFIGKGALLSQKLHGSRRQMVGLILNGPGIMRRGHSILLPNQTTGIITSGVYSPTMEKSIAFGLIPAGNFSDVLVDIRGKQLPASIHKPRFVKAGTIID